MSRWPKRLSALRRDAGVVWNGLRGRNPPPVVDRSPSRYAQPARHTADSARTVTIKKVVRETDDAVSLHLADPAGRPFAFVPGQFFTVLLTIDGREVRRAYSASSSHLDRYTLRLTTKRVTGGLVSNYLNDRAREGQTLRLLGPSGSFTFLPRADGKSHLVLLGGGSGITPLLSIARAALDGEPQSRVTLVYGNRGEGDILFAGELAELARRHGQRFRLRHVLESPPAGWSGGAGRLEPDVVARELDALGVRDDDDCLYYVCGPEAMMAAARRTLETRGVPHQRVREERFFSRTGGTSGAIAADVTVVLAGREKTVRAAAGETVLEAGLGAGLGMPFSCAMGGCGACKVKLVSGEVAMDEPNCLSDTERAQGYVLACVSRPRGPLKVEVA